MTNNTQVYWEANGLSLNTFAVTVESYGGSRWTGPAKRGDDLMVPFQRGRIRSKKSRDSRILNLSLGIAPREPDGTRCAGLTIEQQLHKNYRMVMDSIDVEGQFPLIKRWWNGSQIAAATGMAEYVDSTSPGNDYETNFEIILAMADPYFYDPVALQAIAGMAPIEGEVPTDHMTVWFTSGTDPKFTTADGNWLKYNGTIGTPVSVDVRRSIAMQGSTYVNGLITRNPNFQEWPMLDPAAAVPTLSGGAGSIEYEAAYR